MSMHTRCDRSIRYRTISAFCEEIRPRNATRMLQVSRWKEGGSCKYWYFGSMDINDTVIFFFRRQKEKKSIFLKFLQTTNSIWNIVKFDIFVRNLLQTLVRIDRG